MPNIPRLRRMLREVPPWWRAGGLSAGCCLAAYQPKGASSLVESYVNLANPGMYTAAPGVAPTLGALGWTFTVAQYLKLGIVPQTGDSAIIRFANQSLLGNQMLLGVLDVAAGFSAFVIAPGTLPKRAYYYNATSADPGAKIATGVMALCGQTNSANAYLNGALDAPLASTGGLNISFPVFVGGCSVNGVMSYGAAAEVIALAFYRGIALDAYVPALTSAMNLL